MHAVLPRAGRVYGISKHRSRKCAAVASGRIYCGSESVARANMPDNARSSENAEEGVVYVTVDGQFELGQL